jgi:predicted DNA-binding WGR domain protein
MYDVAGDVYRLRPLTSQPLNLERLEYRNQRERKAHDLIARKGAVKIVSENRIYNAGLELTGKAAVAEDKREYRPQMLIAEEGHVSRAECTCAFFRKQGLKAGPCEHLIALRLAYSLEQRKQAESGKARQTITAETRAFSRRDAEGEQVFQVTLDQNRLKIRWGRSGEKMRLQNLHFNSVDEARAAYFARVDELGARGYLDATAG